MTTTTSYDVFLLIDEARPAARRLRCWPTSLVEIYAPGVPTPSAVSRVNVGIEVS